MIIRNKIDYQYLQSIYLDLISLHYSLYYSSVYFSAFYLSANDFKIKLVNCSQRCFLGWQVDVCKNFFPKFALKLKGY